MRISTSHPHPPLNECREKQSPADLEGYASLEGYPYYYAQPTSITIDSFIMLNLTAVRTSKLITIVNVNT